MYENRNVNQQYIVVKYVMAKSAQEAVNKSRKFPIHEVYVHSNWAEKNTGHNFFAEEIKEIGLVQKANEYAVKKRKKGKKPKC